MPLYEFKCKDCDIVFEELKSAYSNDSTICELCNKPAEKLISVFTTSINMIDSTPSASPTSGCGGCAGGSCACSG
tara:strand:- start:918 stop:1142 length:225 start_codon:yes stop_codon:yes gene_type:complete